MEFEEFYREEVHRVLRTCWLVTLDDEAAADIVQEAMLRAWLRWATVSLTVFLAVDQ